MSATRHRALKLARHVPDGERLFSHLTSKAVRTVLAKAVEDGAPPVERLSSDLLARFPGSFAGLQSRQFVGLTVRAVLEEEGYAVQHPKVRISGDPLFKIGARYRKVPRVRRDGVDGFIERFLSVLTEDEARSAHALLSARLGVAG